MTRPTNLNEIVGQSRVKNVCNVLMKSAIKRDAPIPHCLFSGASGTGKTTFARALAEQSECKIRLANGGTVSSVKDIHSHVSLLNRKDIWFIDEIHRIPMKACESLYTIMEDFRYEFTKDGKPYSQNVAPFTLIGATTDLGIMPKPLRDRFKFVAEFEKYSLDELTEIVLKVASHYGFKLNQSISAIIAKTCRGNPRHVVSRTEWVRDYMISNNKKSIDKQELLSAISMQGFDENGLRPIDHRYINILNNNGVVGLNNIASKLDVDPSTVKDDIEPYLIEQGRVSITTKGRELM